DENIRSDYARKLAWGDTITFTEKWLDCCVGIVDIVNSTKITSVLYNSKLAKYYSIFLNSMSKIAKQFDATIVKNVGDSILYYFPQTADSKNKDAFVKCLECNFSMVEAHDVINDKLFDEKLPSLDYRISLDYGAVMMARTSNSLSEDIFGSPVNMCSKINSFATPNTIVIGGDMHQRIKNFNYYKFEQVKGFSLGFKHTYPTYSLKRNGKGPVGSRFGCWFL
ncbi:MAG TPA: adenylate/guanylate cyclase domain-containing protein, partial [Nitrosopumilaceae archaeon]|nr:adenylate/guanylate cyclase domain-containing protein [Nitrosopumilaceae archaeon]